MGNPNTRNLAALGPRRCGTTARRKSLQRCDNQLQLVLRESMILQLIDPRLSACKVFFHTWGCHLPGTFPSSCCPDKPIQTVTICPIVIYCRLKESLHFYSQFSLHFICGYRQPLTSLSSQQLHRYQSCSILLSLLFTQSFRSLYLSHTVNTTLLNGKFSFFIVSDVSELHN